MEEVRVGLCFGGCVKGGRRLDVEAFIPAEGPVRGDQFAEWVILANNLNPNLASESDLEALRTAFVEYMGCDVVDATLLRRGDSAPPRTDAMAQEEEREDFDKIVRKRFRSLCDLGMVARGTRRVGGSHWDSHVVSRFEASDWTVEIAWAKGEQILSMSIKYNKADLSDSERYVFFEPFVEYLTDGREKVIVPYVTKDMSLASLRRHETECRAVFAAGLEPVVARLAQKLERFLDQVRSASTKEIKGYHAWSGGISRKYVWYEVWSDESPRRPYPVLLLARPGETSFVVHDPIRDEVIFAAQTYDEAREWLLEDDYRLVEGRVPP